MCSRVLGAQKWSRPGRVGAGCDTRVLGLHAAHVGGVQEGSAVPRSGQGWRDVGRRHLVFNIRLASRMPSRQRYTSCMVPLRRSQRARTGRANMRLLTPRESPALTCNVCTALSAPEEAHVFARAWGPGVVPAGQGECAAYLGDNVARRRHVPAPLQGLKSFSREHGSRAKDDKRLGSERARSVRRAPTCRACHRST